MKKWLLREQGKRRPPISLCGLLDISPRFLEVLWHRGLTSPELINAYLSPSVGKLTHPEKWPLIPQSAELIVNALLAGKQFAVWGDYDVDGITATALVLDILEYHGFKPWHHLPDRRNEGYGLNIEGIEKLAAQGCGLLLTVDCGVSDAAIINHARELGLQVVVSDHHLPPPTLPPASGIVNPRIVEAGNWPCAHLAGVGVAFFLMAEVNRLLEKHTGLHFKMDNVLDLVALGTLADIMPVEGENRILIHAGLTHMKKPARPGISALKSVSGLDSSAIMSSDHALFQLAPRLNAAGRMGNPELSLDLLRATSFPQAYDLAEQLNICNKERKDIQQKMFKEACAQADKFLEKGDLPALVLYGENWHPGIIGIVAAKITETYGKPSFALCADGSDLKGSGRSLEGLDLHDALKECANTLLGFGGHKMAAGIRLTKDALPSFRDSLCDAIKRQNQNQPFEDVLCHDGLLDFTQASDADFLAELALMEPFGPGNPEPVFISPELIVVGRRQLGNKIDSVTLDLEDNSRGKKCVLKAKLWHRARELPPELESKKIVIAFTPKISWYNSLRSFEVQIKDWRLVRN